jgi:hypothetical protein
VAMSMRERGFGASECNSGTTPRFLNDVERLTKKPNLPSRRFGWGHQKPMFASRLRLRRRAVAENIG